jgi:hypothetical protein
MAGRFIPDSDVEFANMAKQFADRIAQDPRRYTLSDQDAEELSRKVQAFRDALAKTLWRPKRTAIAVIAKDERRKEAEEIVRRFGRIIRASHQISAADKLAARVKERSKSLRKRKCPAAPPQVWFQGAIGDVGAGCPLHQLRVEPGYNFRGEQPRDGAVRMELFVDLVAPGEPMPAFPGEAMGGRPWYLGSFTKSPIRVAPPVPPTPMLVVYWVRWADSSCRTGPFSRTCEARWEGRRAGSQPTLGAMPEVRQLENDPKQITFITQFRERYIEGVRVEQRMLEDGRGEAKQLAGSDAPSSCPRARTVADSAPFSA